MRILAYLILELANLLSLAITVYGWILLITVLLSWVNPDPYHPAVRFLRQVTDPVLERVRRWMPDFLKGSGIDLSPILVFVALRLTDAVLLNLLRDLGSALLKAAVLP